MNKTLIISAIALIAVIMVVGTVSPTVFADKPEEKKNNGNNGCEKSGNAKACENNPNTEPVSCESCTLELLAAYEVCGDDQACIHEAFVVYQECVSELDYCSLPPPPDF